MQRGHRDPAEGTVVCPDSSHKNVPMIKLHRCEHAYPSVRKPEKCKKVSGSHQRQVLLMVSCELHHILPTANLGDVCAGSLWTISHNCTGISVISKLKVFFKKTHIMETISSWD